MRVRPLVLDGAAPRGIIPAYPMFGADREERCLYVWERPVYVLTAHGWLRIPPGYVTDFGSIPRLATSLSFSRLRPIDTHAWAAGAHDFPYAVGQPGYRPIADQIFRERCKLDGVPALRREIMYGAIRFGGQGGYDRAPGWWDTKNFADLQSGTYPIKAPVPREECFLGKTWGIRERPDWDEGLWIELAARALTESGSTDAPHRMSGR